MLMACPPSGLVSKHTHVMFEDSGGVSALIKCSSLRDIALLLSSIKDNIIMAGIFFSNSDSSGLYLSSSQWLLGIGIWDRTEPHQIERKKTF